MALLCPKCGETDTRPSRRFRWRDLFHRAVSEEAWRCRKCRHRFYVQPKDGSRPKSKRKHGRRRRLIEIGLFAAMLILFYLFLRYITQERAPSGDSANSGFRIVG